jgi:TolB protein
MAVAAALLAACSGSDPEPAEKSSDSESQPGPIVFRKFLDPANTHAALFTMNADGTGSKQLTSPPKGAIDSLPDWSPDGKRIVFHREYADKPYEIYTIAADGTDQRQVDPGCPVGVVEDEGDICEETDPAWSPDGKLLAFSWPHGAIKQVGGEDTIEARGIGVMAPDGSGARLVTQTKRPTSSEDETPSWSPDGRRIAYVRLNISAEPRGATALFVADADGSKERQITPWRMSAADPAWSPDGSLISFRSERPDTDFVGEIHTIRPDGSGLRQLTRAKGKLVYATTFSPDGSRIVFAMTGENAQPDLYVMGLDGSDLRPLTRTPEWESAPDWSPR